MAVFERIFSPEELQDNDERKSRLIDLLRSGEAILMAGAGCTASIYPDWNGFVDLLHQEALKVQQDFAPFNPDTDDFLTSPIR